MYYTFGNLFRKYSDKLTHNKIEENITTESRYNYWLEMLLQRASRLFSWDGLPESCPAFEVEQRYIMQGYCIFSKKPSGQLLVFYGSLANLTGDYFDIPLAVNYYSPTRSGILKVGTECVFGRNTSFLNAIQPIAEHYATLLANVDASFMASCINDRQKGGVPTGSTNKAVESIKFYRKNLISNKILPIQDPAFTQVKFLPLDLKNTTTLSEYTEATKDLISRFYNDIGVKTANEKKGNMIVDEVNANGAMLLVNISEMLDQRRKTADELNRMYGLNVTVDISDEIKNVLNMKEGGMDES